MSNAAQETAGFRKRLVCREFVVGTFVKTPTVHSVEILGALGYDFVVIDAEHAPFDRAAIDNAMLAARAAGTAGLVRVASAAPAEIASALDCGAAGVLVPHVASVSQARQLAAAGRFRGGRRGYSGSPRSAGYGSLPMSLSIDEQDRRIGLIAMIEDVEAVNDIDAIAAVEGVDALFIGRADLTVAMAASSAAAPDVAEAVRRIIAAGYAAGKAICMMVADAQEAAAFRELGATAFIVASDQGFMRKAAAAALKEMAALR